ncbi:MAG: hypothetical protein CMO22_05255 [Thiotrichales bacterium]|nr:hypothetical protein [Thiotrichales bacterium]OUX51731.1 MAG: hypothetical protein CBE42_04880 [Methylococcaceae bacterium TMED282]
MSYFFHLNTLSYINLDKYLPYGSSDSIHATDLKRAIVNSHGQVDGKNNKINLPADTSFEFNARIKT